MATCMEFNETKYALFSYNLHDGLDSFVERYMSFRSLDINTCIKYLGFQLKPKYYLKVDLFWLTRKVEKIISLWCKEWLSRGGHLVLVKFVLEAIPVY